MGFIGLLLAAVMLLISVWLRQSVANEAAGQSLIPILSMFAVGFASFSNDLALPGGWGRAWILAESTPARFREA